MTIAEQKTTIAEQKRTIVDERGPSLVGFSISIKYEIRPRFGQATLT